MIRKFFLTTAIASGLLAASPAWAGWNRAESKHFVIYSDIPTDRLRAFATKLESFDQAVRYARAVPDIAPTAVNKLTVYVMDDLAAIARIYGGEGVGGFYMPRAGATLAFVPLNTSPGDRTDMTAENVFFHEYAHHLFYQSVTAPAPLWLTEGFAEFFSTAQVATDGSVSLGAPATHRAELLLAKFESPLTIERMLEGRLKGLTYWQFGEVYARGWLLTHFLTFNSERKGQLDRYVAGIQQGKPALQAAREAFGDLGRLNAQLKSYVRSKSFPYVVVPAMKIAPGPVAVTALGAGEAAIMPVRMRSRRGVDPAEAERVVRDARLVAARYPADAEVQSALAEAEYDAEYYDGAIAAADRALAVNPRLVDALLHKARALQKKAVAAKSPATDWKAIQKIYLAANKIDPEDPRPLVDYYESFGEAGLAPTANASEGLAYASELAPHDSPLRWTLVRDYIRLQRGPQALHVLQPMALSPHGGKSVERAQTIVEKLSARDFTAAAKIIDDAKAEAKAETEKRKRKVRKR